MTIQLFPAITWHRSRRRWGREPYLTGCSHVSGPRSTNTKVVRKFQQLLFLAELFPIAVDPHGVPVAPQGHPLSARLLPTVTLYKAGSEDADALPRGTALCSLSTGERPRVHRRRRQGSPPRWPALSLQTLSGWEAQTPGCACRTQAGRGACGQPGPHRRQSQGTSTVDSPSRKHPRAKHIIIL